MSRQVSLAIMHGPKARPADKRVVHALLTPAASVDLKYTLEAYQALTLAPVNQSQVIRRALSLLAERLAGLHGSDDVSAEIDAFEGERLPLTVAELTAKFTNKTATDADIEATLKLLQDAGRVST